MSASSSSRDVKHVTTACIPCREAKTKCTGTNPCERCTRKDLECEFGSGKDQRTQRRELKRKLEDLEEESATLRDILKALRESNEADSANILNIIRSGANYNDIYRSIQQHFAEADRQGRERSPILDRLNDEVWTTIQQRSSLSTPNDSVDGHRRRRLLSVTHLVDSPPLKVPAQPWTTVTTDDTLISHILSAWMMWERPFYNWIDREPFLRDMQAGLLNARYCSPFLVNALLAYACSFGDYPEVRNVRGTPSNLSSRLADQAKSFIPEVDEISIPFAQGLVSLFLAESIANRDGTAFVRYALRAGRICDQLATQMVEDGDMELIRATKICCWGSYNQIVMTSWIYRQPCPMELPPSLASLQFIPEDSIDWTPYPDTGRVRPSYEYELLYQRSSLSVIAKDLAMFLSQAKSTAPEARTAQGLLDRFTRWHAELPRYLHVTPDASPSILVHQTHYLSLLISLCCVKIPDESWTVLADQTTWQATLDMLNIFQIYENLYTNTHTCVYLVHPLLMILEILLDSKDLDARSAEITQLCVFFRAMGRRFPFAFAVFRMFQISIRKDKRSLGPSTDKVFDEFFTSDWVKGELAELESNYPVVVAKTLPSEVQNLSDFLATFDHLHIEEEAGENVNGQMDERVNATTIAKNADSIDQTQRQQ